MSSVRMDSNVKPKTREALANEMEDLDIRISSQEKSTKTVAQYRSQRGGIIPAFMGNLLLEDLRKQKAEVQRQIDALGVSEENKAASPRR